MVLSNTAILTLRDKSNTVRLYFSTNSSPKEMMDVFRAVGCSNLPSTLSGILRKYPSVIMMTDADASKAKFNYLIDYTGYNAMYYGGTTHVDNGGEWSYFQRWANAYAEMDYATLKGKIVRFDYRGESDSTFSPRVMKVEDVVNLGGKTTLHGTDLIKLDFRQFRTDRIQGNVTVC